MSHRTPTSLALACCCLLFTTAAFAQTPAGTEQARPLQTEVRLAAAVGTELARPAQTTEQPAVPLEQPAPAQAPIVRAPETARFRRGLIPLFVSYATLQALDVHSTLTVIHQGGFERNPIAAPFVNHPAAFVAFKAGMTTATFLVATRLSRHNRVAAYLLMAGMNGAYAAVVAHNYRVAAQLR